MSTVASLRWMPKFLRARDRTTPMYYFTGDPAFHSPSTYHTSWRDRALCRRPPMAGAAARKSQQKEIQSRAIQATVRLDHIFLWLIKKRTCTDVKHLKKGKIMQKVKIIIIFQKYLLKPNRCILCNTQTCRTKNNQVLIIRHFKKIHVILSHCDKRYFQIYFQIILIISQIFFNSRVTIMVCFK